MRQQIKNLPSIPAIFFGLILLTVAISAEAQPVDWKLIRLPLDETITGVSFPTAKVGYIVTSGGKYGVTVDGGRNWNAYQIKGAPPFEDVYFKSVDTGLAVGRNGGVYRTIKGAQEWERRSFPDSVSWLTSGIFLNDTIALVVGVFPDQSMNGKLYRSTDAGKFWKLVDVTGLGFGELFYRPGVPVCFQSFGKLMYSQDLGATWKSLKTIDGKPGRAVTIFNKTGVICGTAGMLAISADRGATWSSFAADERINFTSAVLVDDSIGFIAGTQAMVMATKDGGKSWKQVKALPSPVDIADLTIAGDKLYAVGAMGSIYSVPYKQLLAQVDWTAKE